jgi:hypothetical protein
MSKYLTLSTNDMFRMAAIPPLLHLLGVFGASQEQGGESDRRWQRSGLPA